MLIHFTVQQKLTQRCKAIITLIKNKQWQGDQEQGSFPDYLETMSKAIGTYSALEIPPLNTHSVLNYLTLSKTDLTRNVLFGYKC